MNDNTTTGHAHSDGSCIENGRVLSNAEHTELRRRLMAMDDTPPASHVWRRIREQGEAQGLIRARSGDLVRWLAGAAIAATVAMLALNLMPFSSSGPATDPDDRQFDAVPPVSVATDNRLPTNLNALMVRSQRIEDDLRALGGSRSVVRAGTAATIAQLEDRIAAIDFILSQHAAGLSPVQVEAYWQQRVRLMNSLLNIRRAQARRVAF